MKRTDKIPPGPAVSAEIEAGKTAAAAARPGAVLLPHPGLSPANGLALYGGLFAFFHILPAFLNFPVWNKLMVADLFDLTTPFVLSFAVWRVLLAFARGEGRGWSTAVKGLAFLGVILFVEGHGIHLSANAIHRHLPPFPPSAVERLTDFFDERLGHILWDSGNLLLGLSILFQNLSGRGESRSPWTDPGLLAGAAAYGFTLFANAVEGQTVIFVLPYSLLLAAALLVARRRGERILSRYPAAVFLFAAETVALCLFAAWWILQGGFPEFSAVGWI